MLAHMSTEFLEAGLLARSGEMIRAHLPGERLGIVCDQTTCALAAEAIFHQLPADKTLIVTLGKRLKPGIEIAETLRRQVARCDALLAVGSGTLNDLCKYVAHRLGIPYGVFATAPSMNGYLSPTASLRVGRQKSSVSAAPPALLLGDLDILAAAPLAMIRAGIGDTLCRNTIESDLILADALGFAEYREADFAGLRALEAELMAFDGERSRRDTGFIRTLMQALLLGGRMMQQAGSSAPCSQGEHMIVHTYDLLYGNLESEALHGEAVAVATVTMRRLQQKLLNHPPVLRPLAPDAARFCRLFGPASGEALHRAFQRKALNTQQADALNETLRSRWPELRERIEQVACRSIRLETCLKSHGCPVRYNQLRWSRHRYEQAVHYAYLTRDRFTFLDLAAMDTTLRAEI